MDEVLAVHVAQAVRHLSAHHPDLFPIFPGNVLMGEDSGEVPIGGGHHQAVPVAGISLLTLCLRQKQSVVIAIVTTNNA